MFISVQIVKDVIQRHICEQGPQRRHLNQNKQQQQQQQQ